MKGGNTKRKALDLPKRSHTQRKIKLPNNSDSNKRICKQIPQARCIKSLSFRPYLPKNNNEPSIIRSQIVEKKVLKFFVKGTTNLEVLNQISSNKMKDNINFEQILETPERALKVKRSNQVKNKNTKLKQFKRKVCIAFENSKNKIIREGSNLFDGINMFQLEEPKKPFHSQHLKSTNCQDPILLQNIPNFDLQTKNKWFPPLKVLKKKEKENERQLKPTRKRVQSCRFVVNPFQKITTKHKSKFEVVTDKGSGKLIEFEQFVNHVNLNEISHIHQNSPCKPTNFGNQTLEILCFVNLIGQALDL